MVVTLLVATGYVTNGPGKLFPKHSPLPARQGVTLTLAAVLD
jgi:hypothetical protein